MWKKIADFKMTLKTFSLPPPFQINSVLNGVNQTYMSTIQLFCLHQEKEPENIFSTETETAFLVSTSSLDGTKKRSVCHQQDTETFYIQHTNASSSLRRQRTALFAFFRS